MESHCHNGNVLRYDTVSERGWSVRLSTHSINLIVEQLLAEDWSEEKEVPDMVNEDECVVRISSSSPSFFLIRL